MCLQCDLWACQRKEKKDRNFHASNAICPDHPRRRRPLKFCMRSRVREVVIYFKFHENQSRGLRAVEGRKSPSPVDLAHGLYNSLYYRTSRDQLIFYKLIANVKAFVYSLKHCRNLKLIHTVMLVHFFVWLEFCLKVIQLNL